MKNKILVIIGFVLCFVVGVICGACLFAHRAAPNVAPDVSNYVGVKCLDGTIPDKDGCCTGEVYTNMGDLGWNCCPDSGDCFPPIK